MKFVYVNCTSVAQSFTDIRAKLGTIGFQFANNIILFPCCVPHEQAKITCKLPCTCAIHVAAVLHFNSTPRALLYQYTSYNMLSLKATTDQEDKNFTDSLTEDI